MQPHLELTLLLGSVPLDPAFVMRVVNDKVVYIQIRISADQITSMALFSETQMLSKIYFLVIESVILEVDNMSGK